MGFLRHFRSKSRLKDKDKVVNGNSGLEYYPGPRGRDYTARINDQKHILNRIFSYVCPHVNDESYDASEKSMVGDGCMLCDLRDLSNCCKVKRSWYGIASGLLYKSIRIDAVHYCELEEMLTEIRQRKHHKSRGADPLDPPGSRLQQLSRTLRDNPYLAETVVILKIPYMTRETYKADLARTVSVLQNLRYVDLPDGCFGGDPSCITLVQELTARCRHIRKMKYSIGAEQRFEQLSLRHWPELEILELSKIRIEPSTFRQTLAALPLLKELHVSELSWMSDIIFQQTPTLPDFPPLRTLSIRSTPNITAAGIVAFVSPPRNRETLTNLILSGTGVTVVDLHTVLWAASSLRNLSVTETVKVSLPLDPLPPLTSITLSSLHFEITSSADHTGTSLHPPAASHYAYLATSLHANALPALRELYVRDPDFPEQLVLAPPAPAFAADARPANPPRGFDQPLEVYTKGLDELDWVITSVTPTDSAFAFGSSPESNNYNYNNNNSYSPHQRHQHQRHQSDAGDQRRGSVVLSTGRPLSLVAANKGLGPQWGGDARKSVVVGNGFGGFLAVPQVEDPSARPRSAGSLSGGFAGQGGGHHGGWDAGGGGGAAAAGGGGGPGADHLHAGGAVGPGAGVRDSIVQSLSPGRQTWYRAHERRGSRHDLWR